MNLSQSQFIFSWEIKRQRSIDRMIDWHHHSPFITRMYEINVSAYVEFRRNWSLHVTAVCCHLPHPYGMTFIFNLLTTFVIRYKYGRIITLPMRITYVCLFILLIPHPKSFSDKIINTNWKFMCSRSGDVCSNVYHLSKTNISKRNS